MNNIEFITYVFHNKISHYDYTEFITAIHSFSWEVVMNNIETITFMTHIFHNRFISVTIMNDVKFITHFHNNFTHRRIFHNTKILHPLQVYLNCVENLVEKCFSVPGDIWPLCPLLVEMYTISWRYSCTFSIIRLAIMNVLISW